MNIKKVVLFFVIVIFLLFVLFPFYWQLICSLKPPLEIFTRPPEFFTKKLYLKNYYDIFTSSIPFLNYLKNSFIVALFTAIISIIFGCFAGYALGRMKVHYKNIILGIILSSAMFPQIAIVGPLFLIFRKLSLLNTYPGLIIPYCSFGLPLVIWLMMNFFKDLPSDIEDAAKIDGASTIQIMIKIMTPLAIPGIITSIILVFIFAWNEFLFSLIFNTTQAMRTVTVGITMFPGLYEIPWGTIFAASSVVTLPVVIVVLLLQKRIVAGLTAGALK
ncbi:MAG: carbohydrate ABC transporter permease [Elusimicrobiota bacterium]|nr:carbohydrate ABC transporter permease [Elusimicrobiota bacterium]